MFCVIFHTASRKHHVLHYVKSLGSKMPNSNDKIDIVKQELTLVKMRGAVCLISCSLHSMFFFKCQKHIFTTRISLSFTSSPMQYFLLYNTCSFLLNLLFFWSTEKKTSILNIQSATHNQIAKETKQSSFNFVADKNFSPRNLVFSFTFFYL